MSYFETVLNFIGLNPIKYIEEVNKKRNIHNYEKIFFSDKPKYKLMTTDPKTGKKIYFGSTINNDYIIYSMLEKRGRVPKGTAEKHRGAYLARALNIGGNWKKNK